MKVDHMETEWEENRKNFMSTISDLREENNSLRGQLSNKDKEKKSELLTQDRKIKDLQHAIEIRKGNLNSLLTDLDNKNKEVEDMKKYVKEMRNEKTGTQISTPVAKPEKPKTLLAEPEKPP